MEGWSSATRGSKAVVGYYTTAPTNMRFQKEDRVNFAYFQMDGDGNVWGCDPWGDPIALL